jgi:glucokinase
MSKNSKTYSIGVDIGGTKMLAVLFDGAKVIADFILATPKDSLDHFLIMLNALIEPLVEKAREDKVKIKGVGLGVAGIIDYQEGIMLESTNIPIINGVNLAKVVSERIDMPVAIDNDGNTFIRAEVMMGAGKKYKNAFGFVIGTGIGGGWWVNGNVYRVAHGGSTEPGNMIINFDTGMGLEAAYHKLTQNNPGNLAEEAYRGDILAEKTFHELGCFFGMAFANIANLIMPEIIIIGGGVVESGDLFLSHAKKAMRENIASPEAKKRIRIVKGKLGQQAGAIGAALLVG